MKMKHYAFSLSLVFGSFLFSIVCAETLERLSNETFTDPLQPAVPFLHDEHNKKAGLDEDCSHCHHLYEDNQLVEGESSEDMACAECHAPVHFSDGVSLTAAFHKRCKGCHLALKQGPIVCGQCHGKGEYQIGKNNTMPSK